MSLELTGGEKEEDDKQSFVLKKQAPTVQRCLQPLNWQV
jgi:hypothetical protein